MEFVEFDDTDDEFETLMSDHRSLATMAASAADSDLEFAFRLQLEEVMAASLALQSPLPTIASSSSSSSSSAIASSSKDGGAALAVSLQTLELDRLHQEKKDIEQCHADMCRVGDDLRRRDHDARFAREIHQMPEDEWEDYGDDFQRPMDSVPADGGQPFRLYFKGMEGTHYVKGAWVQLAAIGVTACDSQDRPVIQIQKPVPGGLFGREALEIKALIEGLNAVISLGIKRINVYTDYKTLYNHITGKWRVKQRNVAHLINQLLLLQRKMDKCQMNWLPQCHIKFAFKLAKDAIYSQIIKSVDSTANKDHKETCNICLEATDLSQMFAVDGCLHRYCFSCISKHVEVKLLHGMLPVCPHEGCKTKLSVESLRKFLSPKLLDRMIHRVKEASIPVTDKVYCPYPKCSALMSINEAICPQQNSSSQSGLRKCIKCDGSFCIKCKVPWHARMSCYDYKKLNPHRAAEEAKLQSLARLKLWRQCVKCNHMIELAEGCFHMTCRCGYEFCYTCGAEWRDKKATCSCPLWHEDYILHDDSEDEYSDDSYYDDDGYDFDYDRW